METGAPTPIRYCITRRKANRRTCRTVAGRAQGPRPPAHPAGSTPPSPGPATAKKRLKARGALTRFRLLPAMVGPDDAPLLGDRLAVGLRTLTPPTLVRIQVPQPLFRSSSIPCRAVDRRAGVGSYRAAQTGAVSLAVSIPSVGRVPVQSSTPGPAQGQFGGGVRPEGNFVVLSPQVSTS